MRRRAHGKDLRALMYATERRYPGTFTASDVMDGNKLRGDDDLRSRLNATDARTRPIRWMQRLYWASRAMLAILTSSRSCGCSPRRTR